MREAHRDTQIEYRKGRKRKEVILNKEVSPEIFGIIQLPWHMQEAGVYIIACPLLNMFDPALITSIATRKADYYPLM
jgi:hypothetical protein